MAFMMTKKNREFRYPYTDGVAITIRSFTDAERSKFELNLNKIRGTKNFGEKFEKLLKQVATKLIIKFEGVVDEAGKEVVLPADDEARFAITSEFVADSETRKYWYRPLSEYLYPGRADEEASPIEGEDPDF